MTGDGLADIVGFGESQVVVAKANGDGAFAKPIVGLEGLTPSNGGWNSFNQYPRQLADVTGDGLADIVGFGPSQVVVATANGDGTFANPIVALNGFTPGNGGWNSFDRYPRQLADVTGDGLADIVGFGESQVVVAKANGDGTFAKPIVGLEDLTPSNGGWNSFDRYPRQLADVTGDGLADIVGFGPSQVVIATANGDGTFANPIVGLENSTTVSGGWSSFDKNPRQLADVTGDGLADIVGFWRRTGICCCSQHLRTTIRRSGDHRLFGVGASNQRCRA